MLSTLASRIDAVLPYLQRRRVFEGEPARSMDGVRWMELDNCWVRYLVRGDGPRTVVLAPDSPVTMEAYGTLLDLLTARHRVVLFETPAFGFSVPKPHFDFSYPAWTETIAEFLRRLGLGPYVLAIPCVAGLSAVGIARRYPEMVEGLVATQMPSWSEERKWLHSWDKGGVMTAPFWAQGLGHYYKTRKVHLAHRIITNKNRGELMELSRVTLAQGASNPLATACQCYLLEGEPDALGVVEQPAVAVWGDADRSHDRAGTDKRSVLRYLPNANVVHLPEAGHFLEVEEPGPFAEIVTGFMDGLPSR